MDLCLDCEKLECSTGEYLDCSRRKAHAAELGAAAQARPGRLTQVKAETLPGTLPSTE
jgi:hypothetical protein